MKAYLTMNGSYGCLPDNTQVFTNTKDAIEYLTNLFHLDKKQVKELKECMYLDLNPQKDSAQYCEIEIENMSKSEI